MKRDELSQSNCEPCKGNTPKLNYSEISKYLSEINEWSVNESQDMIFKKFEFTQDQESVGNIKNIIGKLHKNHPSKLFLDQFNDFAYDAGVVDIFLHPKEKFYSLSSLIKELEKNNFLIKNFVDGKIKKFYQEVCLLEQTFVMDNKTKISECIAAFNKEHNENFEIKRPFEMVKTIPKAWVLESGDIRITPANSNEKYGLDGFYICYLQKKPNTF